VSSSLLNLNVNVPQFIPCNDFPQNSLGSSKNQNHKLPKLNLPVFSGNLLEWQTFWDCFETSIHSNNSLSDVEKFSYLRSLLCGEALQIVSGFTLTNTNYRQALDVLSERYGQPHKITNAYMQMLMDLPAPKSIPNIRVYINKIETYMRSLESLGTYPDTYAALLVPTIMKKLPQEFLREITRQNGGDHWDIRTICRAIKTELAVYEMTDFNNVGYSEGNITSSFITKVNTGRRPGNLEQKKGARLDEKLCIFCNENHSPVKCNLDHNKKLEKIKNDKLCFNCLGKQRVADCKSNKSCKGCNRRHHTSICTQQENTVKVPVHKEKTSVSTSPSHSNVVNLHSTSSRSSKVLLKTAVAEIQSTNGTGCQAKIIHQ
jgi:hypothetical protein